MLPIEKVLPFIQYEDKKLFKQFNRTSKLISPNDLIITKNGLKTIEYYNKKHIIIKDIINKFKNQDIKQNLTIGKYKIDLYFPKYNIVVNCEEYNSLLKYENEKQTFIENILDCVYIKFNANNYKFNANNYI